jgi:hypothetical protein
MGGTKPSSGCQKIINLVRTIACHKSKFQYETIALEEILCKGESDFPAYFVTGTLDASGP